MSQLARNPREVFSMRKMRRSVFGTVLIVVVAGCGAGGEDPEPGYAASKYSAEVDKVKENMVERMKKRGIRVPSSPAQRNKTKGK
jgi:hypothetical protein